MKTPEKIESKNPHFQLIKRTMDEIQKEIKEVVETLSKKELASNNNVTYSSYFGYDTQVRKKGVLLFNMDFDDVFALSNNVGLQNVDLADHSVNATYLALCLMEAKILTFARAKVMHPNFRLLFYSLLHKQKYEIVRIYLPLFMNFIENHEEIFDILFQIPILRKSLIEVMVMESDLLKVSSKSDLIKYMGYMAAEDLAKMDEFAILKLLRSLGFMEELNYGINKTDLSESKLAGLKTIFNYEKSILQIIDSLACEFNSFDQKLLWDIATYIHPDIVRLMREQTAYAMMRNCDGAFLFSAQRNYKNLYEALEPKRAILDVLFVSIMKKEKIPEKIINKLGPEFIFAITEKLLRTLNLGNGETLI